MGLRYAVEEVLGAAPRQMLLDLELVDIETDERIYSVIIDPLGIGVSVASYISEFIHPRWLYFTYEQFRQLLNEKGFKV